MAFRSFLIFGLILILNSCAQIGTLTGGEKDNHAPKPIENKIVPLNGTINFQANSIEIPFDEYIKLNNPTENIFIVPPHTEITTTYHKKVVSLNWKDSLQENTTYTIYLNRAIKDITEGNDSLMQFVFSTGNFIDSLSYKIKVIDAFTNEPMSNSLVGLYSEKTDSVLPTYFAQTDKNGWAKLNYLKKGNYIIRAFDDKNKDLLYQNTERIGIRTDKIIIDSNTIDSNFIRLFTPLLPPSIISIKYNAPSLFEVEFNRQITNATFKLNDVLMNESDFTYISKNKISFIHSVKDTSIKSIDFSVATKEFKDTLSFRILEKDKVVKPLITNNLTNNTLFEKDTLKIIFTDQISTIDVSKIQLIHKKDTSKIKIDKTEIMNNNLFIYFTKKGFKDILLIAEPKAIMFQDLQLKDSIKLNFSIREEKEFGSINLDASAYKKPIIIEVLLGDKVKKTLYFTSGSKKLIDQLEPGEYTFRVLLDENKDGEWTTGNSNLNLLPEKIQLFLEPTKVRANWEIDLKLIPKENYE